MHKIFHGKQLTYKEIENSKDKIYCILITNNVTSKLIYYIKTKEDKKLILKGITTDAIIDLNTIKNDSKIRVYEVNENNKKDYIKNNVKISDEEMNNLEELFIKTYEEYE